MDEFGLVQARSLAHGWSRGFGPMHELASTGRIASRPALRAEAESCLADLLEVRSRFPGDDVIDTEVAQMKRLIAWIAHH